jgi:hypothetical protein
MYITTPLLCVYSIFEVALPSDSDVDCYVMTCKLLLSFFQLTMETSVAVTQIVTNTQDFPSSLRFPTEIVTYPERWSRRAISVTRLLMCSCVYLEHDLRLVFLCDSLEQEFLPESARWGHTMQPFTRGKLGEKL